MTLQQRLLLLSQAKALQRGLYDTKFFFSYWLGIETNPFQDRALEKLDQALWGDPGANFELVESILHAGNRSGKTTLLAGVHIKFAYYKIGVIPGQGYDDFNYRTFNISPVSRQARECTRKIEDILLGRFSWEKNGKRFTNKDSLKLQGFFISKNENLGETRYSNRSVTYSVSTGEDQGSSIQGQPGGFISYDECVLSHHLEEEMDARLYSRLGDYGRLLMLVATPDEDAKSQQYFHHLTHQAIQGENDFIVISGSYQENVFIPQQKRDAHVAMIKKKNPEIAKQILSGDFVTTGGKMFETGVIENIWNEKDGPTDPLQDHDYIIAVDLGFSDKGDEFVALVIDHTFKPFEIVYAYSKKGGDPYELIAILRNLKNNYNDAEIVLDTDAMGGTIFKKLIRNMRPVSFSSAGTGEEKQNALFYTQVFLTKNRKRRLINNEYIEDNPDFGWIRSYYLPSLASQLATYKEDDRKLKQDWVSALYMACWRLWSKYGDKEQKKKSFKLHPFKTHISEAVKQHNIAFRA